MNIKESSKEKESAALFSIIAASGLTSAKLIVGLLTGSLGILSDAAHSGIDLVASAITYVAVRISKKPPDSDHPYGHGKIENVSALIEFLILFLVCFWIIYEAVGRIINKDFNININAWAFVVMIIAIGIDYSRYKVLKKTAEKYKSAALEADAIHFLSDMITTLTVIVGLILVKMNIVIGDSIASILVALYIMRLSYKLARKTISSLMDTVPEKIHNNVTNIIREYPGISGYKGLRVRDVGDKVFIDVNVQINRHKTFEESHATVDKLEEDISKEVENADIVVHAEPVKSENEDIKDKIKGISSKYNAGIHDLLVKKINGKLYIDVDMEFDHDTSLKDAFDKTRNIKKEIYREIRQVEAIDIHIEDKDEDVKPAADVSEKYPEIVKSVKKLVKKIPEIKGFHNLRIYKIDNNLKCVLHCEFEDSLTVEQTHKIIGILEKNIKGKIKEIDYIVIQPEPKNNSGGSNG